MVMILSDTGRHNGCITGVVARMYSEEKLPARYQPKKPKRAYKPTKKNPGSSKITEKEVLEIRAMAGVMNNSKIADLFGISKPAVQAIISRRNWGHVQ